jgi:uncharacterized membrane protein
MKGVIMPNCSNCSASVDADAKFCLECGKPVSQTIHCPKCGGTLTIEAKFCKHCAFDLSQPIQSVATVQTTLNEINVQTDTTVVTNTNQSETEERSGWGFVSPSVLILICFFLPWIEHSCGSISGAKVAESKAGLYLIPLLAIVFIGAFAFFKSQNETWKVKPVFFFGSIIGFVLMVYAYIRFQAGTSTEFFGQRINAGSLGFSLGIGAWGTLLGFIANFICGILISDSAKSNENLKIKQNIAATLCYSNYTVMSVLGLLLLLLIPKEPSLQQTEGIVTFSVFIVILGIVSIFLPIWFLITNPYKTNKFIRFNAFQFLIIYAINLGLSFSLQLLFSSSSNQETIKSFVFFSGIIGIGITIVGYFLSYKAYNNEILKIPVIGDWAMNWAEKHSAENQSNEIISQPVSFTASESASVTQPVIENEQKELKDEAANSSTTNFSELGFGDNIEKRLNTLETPQIRLIGLIVIIGVISVFIILAVNNSLQTPSANKTVSSNTNSIDRQISNSSFSSVNSGVNVAEPAGNVAIENNDDEDYRIGKIAMIDTNLVLRSASNKTASQVGVHYQGAKVRVLEIDEYDTADGYSLGIVLP